MKKFLVSYYFRTQGAMSRLGGSLEDRTGYGNTVWEAENLPQNNLELLNFEKDISRKTKSSAVIILAISPLQ